VIVRILGRDDASVLERIAADVFDNPIDATLVAEFLGDRRHHLAVAIDNGVVVGMASGVHYLHPDKPPELFINEVGVSPDYRNQGIGRALLGSLFEHAKTLGCREAWLGTDETNTAARRMYASAGGIERPMLLVAFQL
jgi:ribosomal protein S18 acetylase RimI-like enzyme